MKTLYLERSTGEVRDGGWVERLDLDGIGRIVVGTGPGSFAGIRSAIAFAQGYRLGRPGVEVLGLPSPCGIIGDLLAGEAVSVPEGTDQRIAVVGDARQGKIWIALFAGYLLEKDVFQIDSCNLMGAVPAEYRVVSPDDRRIGGMLRDLFGERYLGGQTPSEAGLRAFAEACPSILRPEPLPIYLNPAVRS